MQTAAMDHDHRIADLRSQVRSVAYSGQTAPDNARQQFAGRMLKHLEASGFEIDDPTRCLGGSRGWRDTTPRTSSRLSSALARMSRVEARSLRRVAAASSCSA
jgi:hypothetical protein